MLRTHQLCEPSPHKNTLRSLDLLSIVLELFELQIDLNLTH